MEKHMKIGSLVIASALVISLTLGIPALASSCCGNGHGHKPPHNNPNSWDWIPGTHSIDSAAGSQIETHLITWTEIGESSQEHAISDLENHLHFVVIYDNIENCISQITIPAENFSCDPFYITTTTISNWITITKHLWGDLRLEENGHGQKAVENCCLDNVDCHVEVIHYENCDYENQVTKENCGPAGSTVIHLELYLDVYHSPDNTGIEAEFELLVTLELSVNLTTGSVSIHATDESAYPSGSTSIHCKSLSCEGSPEHENTGAATLVGVAGALDVYSELSTIIGPIDSYTDFISQTTLVIPENFWT